ncbi:MAG: T9SS type A sorting domain-containing protein [Bacteroidia bacterium]|jgi:hypothetical protein|nr:T9SS type A sorting domain-containing protein [Bacteroidia bacterium]
MKKYLYILLFTGVLSLSGYAQSPFTVYGLARNSTPAQLYLASMQPTNGLVSEISPASIGQFFALNVFSAIDPVSDMFYYGPGSGVLYAVDMNTGITTDTLNLSIPAGTNFDMMQYNCADSSLYGIYRTGSPGGLFLAKTDLTTGQVTVISPNSVGTQSVLNARSTIDPFNNVYYFYDGTSLKGLDLATGLIVSQVPFSFSGPGQFFDLMTYNCGDGKIYGITRVSSSPALYPAWIDPATGVVTNLSSTSLGSFIVLNAMSEINPIAGVFHFFNGSSFISYDVNTGNVLASPPLTFSPSPGNIFFDMIARDNCKCFLSNPNVGMAETVTPQIKIFPSPAAAGQPIHVMLPSGGEERILRIYDVAGALVEERNLQAGENNLVINTERLAAGSYIVSVNGLNPVKLLITQ